ncbi:hypothetical protein BESB_035260 [Besnoitia besnoiti]|uniref:Ig-like domain-containing protein n=1 Tax=Besnoitia besnoiti TaxID=94643 RepID=A0A2A9MEY0_BESBE|nr:hypothetical protein BESB_035260 [Besnoitia besnoiti]PFH37068.1 hypothetical protein BESB_035260 [Besnoitia besnoiti]
MVAPRSAEAARCGLTPAKTWQRELPAAASAPGDNDQLKIGAGLMCKSASLDASSSTSTYYWSSSDGASSVDEAQKSDAGSCESGEEVEVPRRQAFLDKQRSSGTFSCIADTRLSPSGKERKLRWEDGFEGGDAQIPAESNTAPAPSGSVERRSVLPAKSSLSSASGLPATSAVPGAETSQASRPSSFSAAAAKNEGQALLPFASAAPTRASAAMQLNNSGLPAPATRALGGRRAVAGHVSPASSVENGGEQRQSSGRSHGAKNRAVVLGLLNDLLQALPTANVDEVLESLEPLRRLSTGENAFAREESRVSSRLSEASLGSRTCSNKASLQRRGSKQEAGAGVVAQGRREGAEKGTAARSAARAQPRRRSVSSRDSDVAAGSQRKQSLSNTADQEGKTGGPVSRLTRRFGSVASLPPLAVSRHSPGGGELPSEARREGGLSKPRVSLSPPAFGEPLLAPAGGPGKGAEVVETPLPTFSAARRSSVESQTDVFGRDSLRESTGAHSVRDVAPTLAVSQTPESLRSKEAERDEKAGAPSLTSGASSPGSRTLEAKFLLEQRAEDLQDWLAWAGSYGYVPGLYCTAAVQGGAIDAPAAFAAPGALSRKCLTAPTVGRAVRSPSVSETLRAEKLPELSRMRPPYSPHLLPGSGGRGRSASLDSGTSRTFARPSRGVSLEAPRLEKESKESRPVQLLQARENGASCLLSRRVAPPAPLFTAVAETADASAPAYRAALTDDSYRNSTTLSFSPEEEEDGEDIDIIALPRKRMPITPQHFLQTPRPAWLKGSSQAAKAAVERRAATAAARQEALEAARLGDRAVMASASESVNSAAAQEASVDVDRALSSLRQETDIPDTARSMSLVSAPTFNELFFPRTADSETQTCISDFWKALPSPTDVAHVFSRTRRLLRRNVPDVFVCSGPEKLSNTRSASLPPVPAPPSTGSRSFSAASAYWAPPTPGPYEMNAFAPAAVRLPSHGGDRYAAAYAVHPGVGYVMHPLSTVSSGMSFVQAPSGRLLSRDSIQMPPGY